MLERAPSIGYDLLLLSAVVFVAALPLPLLPEPVRALWWGRLIIQGYVLGVGLVFFGWFWVHGGQTLGMRAWRLRLVATGGGRITWRHATVRYLAALLSWAAAGLGFAWSLFDDEKRSWHDLLSGTRLVLMPRGYSHNTAQQQRAGGEENQGGQHGSQQG